MIFILVLAFTMSQVWSQEKVDMPPLIGDKAPSFSAKTTNGRLSFPSDFGKSWKILFSHPQDFTPVCSSEILELAYLQSKFNELGVKVAVISADPVESHKNWKTALEGLNYKGRENVKIEFPIIDDEKLEISRKYGMIHPETNSTKTVRGVFIIDPNNVVQAISFNPMSIGRNTDEIVRLVEALQAAASNEVLTPANWTTGDDFLVPFIPDANSSKETLEKEGYHTLSWFMIFKKSK